MKIKWTRIQMTERQTQQQLTLLEGHLMERILHRTCSKNMAEEKKTKEKSRH